jgi:hypothetical protein
MITPYDSQLCDHKAFKATVTASATIASTIGEALPGNAIALTFILSGDNPLYYQCDGNAADSDSCEMPAGMVYTVYGGKTKLDNIRLYGAAGAEEHGGPVGFVAFGKGVANDGGQQSGYSREEEEEGGEVGHFFYGSWIPDFAGMTLYPFILSALSISISIKILPLT